MAMVGSDSDVCHESVYGFKEIFHLVKGRSAVSNVRCGPSQVILRQAPYCFTLFQRYWQTYCSNCFTSENNLQDTLLKCSKCKEVRYCSVQCQKSDYPYHKAICSSNLSRMIKSIDSEIVDEIILLLKSIYIMKKVADYEKCKCIYDNNTKEYFSYCGRYHFQNMVIGGGQLDSHMIQIISAVCSMTNEPIKYVSDMFGRFQSNNFAVTNSLLVSVGMGVYPRAAILNHSCQPNCIIRYKHLENSRPILEIVTIKDVMIGEEFTHCYVDASISVHEKSLRLQKIYGFHCDCRTCFISTKAKIERWSRVQECLEKLELFYEDVWSLYDYVSEMRYKCSLEENSEGTSCFILNTIRSMNEKVQQTITEEHIKNQVNEILSKADELGLKSSMNDDNEPSDYINGLLSLLNNLKCLVGPYHSSLYKLHCLLLSSYLLSGFIEGSLSTCKKITCHLLVTLFDFPYHPLIGLQMYTLGDLFQKLNRRDDAKKAYHIAKEQIACCHGIGSQLFNSIEDCLRSQDSIA